MEFRIEELGEFKMVGYVMSTTNACMKGMEDGPAFWQQMIQEGKVGQLAQLISRPPFGIIGASVYNVDEQDSRKFDYYIAAATDQPTPEGLIEYTVPAVTWAVFSCSMENLGTTQADIVTKWAPASAYEILNQGYETGEMISAAPDLEVYGQGTDVEIWVPVKARA